jgi:hypothetical protein
MLNTGDFEENGFMIGKMKLPTRVIQEGWYKNRSPQTNARAFFNGHTANRWIKNLGIQLSSQVNQMARLSLKPGFNFPPPTNQK